MKVSNFGHVYIDNNKSICFENFHFTSDNGEVVASATYYDMIIAISDYIREVAEKTPETRVGINFLGNHLGEDEIQHNITVKEHWNGGVL